MATRDTLGPFQAALPGLWLSIGWDRSYGASFWFRLFGRGLSFLWMPRGEDTRSFSARNGYRASVKIGRLAISAVPALEPWQ